MMLVANFIERYALQSRLDKALAGVPGRERLLSTIGALALKKSSATRRLGSYVSRAGKPVAIRLQFALEEPILIETFLHELAHCLDHLTNQTAAAYRRAHGEGWRRWAAALGINPQRCGDSAVLQALAAERLKVVAICMGCGFELKRLRRLPARRRYLHTSCGGRLVPVKA